MLNAINVILLSPRRYGKTSLLLEAMARVRDKDGRTGYASLLRCTNTQEIVEALLNGIINGPLSWLTRQHARMSQLFGRTRLGLSFEFDVTGTVRVSLNAADRGTNWRSILTDALSLLSHAGKGKRPVSLILDEFQHVAEI